MAKEWSYEEIKKINEMDAKEMCLEEMKIKDFQCYFVDFNGRFGYSAIVFKNGYCVSESLNMYQLHNSSAKNADELKQRYIHTINNNLFSDKELCEPIKDYDDYSRKRFYIINYMPLEYDRLTMCAINGKYSNLEDIAKSESGKYTYPSRIAYAYFQDDSFDRRACPLLDVLEKSYEELRMEPEFFRQAVRRGLNNHEAGYTGDFIEGVESVGYDFLELDTSHQNIVCEEFAKCCGHKDYKKTAKNIMKSLDLDYKKKHDYER